MFTFGIFTTHIPYIAFVVFYAWFLLFGVEKANDGKIQISERSVEIQYHVNDFQPEFIAEFDFQKCFCNQELNHLLLSCTRAQQKLKWQYRQSFYFQDPVPETLFSRPPPALA